MQTTLELSDRLIEEAKKKAAREGTSLDAIVEDALRVALASATGGHRSESTDGEARPRDFKTWAEVLDFADEVERQDAAREGRPVRYR